MESVILLVEDSPNQRLLYQAELMAEGYDVVLACDGKEAIEKLHSHHPDLVVMDIAMPNMDGLEALGKVLASERAVPVILNTAYASYRDSFMSWSADAYVLKSSDLGQLKAKIAELLALREHAANGDTGVG